MFQEMLMSLKEGVLPPAASLRRRLALALVKKSGILQQPRPCWSNDPKINPEARHLLWAAVIIEDVEAIGLAAGLLSLEIQAGHPDEAHSEIRAEVSRQLHALSELMPNHELRRVLQARIDRAGSFLP
jgi:hypothetical protein